ncbi:hypothetical protein GHT06_021614 [Daphnia sinensis]|uniref:hAT-like transposase RNase-H fold domain-containing protein n=1 Tax=Daphnia sinensis TaxID=1820382 RepID=A0AAD5KJD0_9CRUS|nr:hypothetical protein GHT06_021614 [Daphnia sinensis]
MECDEEHEQNISIGKENIGEDDVDSDNEESQIRLPRHFRCTCHILNLIATTDVKNIVNQRFSKLKKQLDAKLSTIWNRPSRSSLASDYIKKIMGELFVIHNATRWNSYYDALRKVQHFVTHKFEELQMVFDHFKVKRMTTVEMDFLKEFIKVMKPISDALDVFKSESKMSCGCVLPVQSFFKETLICFQEDRSFTHCVHLITCLIDGVERRFCKLFDDDFMRLAAISDPHFKLTWSPEEKKAYDTDLLKREVKRRGNATLDRTQSSHDEESCRNFSPPKGKKPKRNRFLEGLKIKRASTDVSEVERYFNDGVGGSLEDLHRFPTIKQIFL